MSTPDQADVSNPPAPSLTVIFAATHDSALMREAAKRHQEQLAVVGGELLVADGSLDGLPDEVPTAVRMPGADVFTLRDATAKLARGRIVAFTEDHCVPDDDWVAAILRAHDEHPDIAAIGGSVVNASDADTVDWANFLLTFAPFLPPLTLRHPTRSTPPANVSVKRSYLEEIELVPGRLELEALPHIYRVGHMEQDDRVLVTHIQPRTGRSAIAAHFHNGRSTASLPYRRPPVGELLRRTAHCIVLPARLLREVLGVARGKPTYRRVIVVAAPMVAVLAVAHAVGEIVGMWFGPGRSPEQLD